MSRQVLSYDEIAEDAAGSFVYEPPSLSQNKKKRKRKEERSYQHRDRQLTQAEVWDDSALIAAWDDAVQDFERHNYPDIEPKSRAADVRLNQYATADTLEEEQAADNTEEAYAPEQSYNNGNHSAFSSSIPMPPSSGDETMRNMLMAWYFAGYYTGLFQGQQGQAASADEQQQAKQEQQSSRKASDTKSEMQATKTDAARTEIENVDIVSDSNELNELGGNALPPKQETKDHHKVEATDAHIEDAEDVRPPE